MNVLTKKQFVSGVFMLLWSRKPQIHLISGRKRVWMQFNHFFEILNSTLYFVFCLKGVMLVCSSVLFQKFWA